MLDSAHRPVAGPFPQTTKRPVVGPEVPVMGPIRNSSGASGESGSSSRVKEEYKIRAASDAPPRKSFSHLCGIRYSFALPVVRSILRMGCIMFLLPTPSTLLRRRCRIATDGDENFTKFWWSHLAPHEQNPIRLARCASYIPCCL